MPPIIPAPTDIPEDEVESMPSATVGNILIEHSDSDSESENLDHNGYELLSQDPDNVFNPEYEEEENNSSDMEEAAAAEIYNMNNTSVQLPASEYRNNERTSEVRIMTEAHIETIKSVMKGITLPSSSLPQWASLVPEEEWKAALFSEMHARKVGCTHMAETHIQSSETENNFNLSQEVLR